MGSSGAPALQTQITATRQRRIRARRDHTRINHVDCVFVTLCTVCFLTPPDEYEHEEENQT
eukprot:1349760-Amorphochlora_amoeboformis.AAC.1